MLLFVTLVMQITNNDETKSTIALTTGGWAGVSSAEGGRTERFSEKSSGYSDSLISTFDLRSRIALLIGIIRARETLRSSRVTRKIVELLEKKGVRILSFYDAL